MEQNTLKLKGLLIQAGEKKYRIYHVANGQCFLCDTESSRLELSCYDEKMLRYQIEIGEITVVDEEAKVIAINNLNEKQRKTYEKKVAFINDVKEAYGPTYEGLNGKAKKPKLQKIIAKHGLAKNTAWRTITKYLKSGCREELLVSKNVSGRAPTSGYHQTKKAGRPSKDPIELGKPLEDKDVEAMKYGVLVYMKNKQATMKDAYNVMRDKYYSVPSLAGEMTLLPPNMYPTFRQFEYFLGKELRKEDKDVIKLGKQEYRNNMRLLTGSSQTFVDHPGQIVEIDALEADISLVSEDLLKTVGRPIVYLMVDVFSRAIVACSVSFENNSKLGFTNLMINLADNKEAYGDRYGFSSDLLSQWPTGIIPEQMRVDRGSEYRCHHFAEICSRMKIEANLMPAGMGSMKGLVEGKFHEFQTTWRAPVAKKGLITKDHNSRHHDQAALKLEEFAQILIAFVLSYNTSHIKDYPLKKELIDAGVTLFSPINIWEYGCRTYGEPRWITEANHDQFLYDLLEESKAKISRRGITIDGLIYTADDPYVRGLMISAGKSKEPFMVRRDPRDVSSVYYAHDGRLHKAVLDEMIPGMDAYKGMTLFEYERQYELEKEVRRAGIRHNDELEHARALTYEAIVKAGESTASPDSSDMKTSRRAEQDRVNYENRLETHLNAAEAIPEPKEVPALEEAQEPETIPTFKTEEEYLKAQREAIDKYRRSQYK